MMARDPFQFLKDLPPAKRITLLLLACIKQAGGQITLSLQDVTSVEDGSGVFNSVDDTGTNLVLRFARRGAEAYFVSDDEPTSPPRPSRSPSRTPTVEESPAPRHSVHSDMDLAMREEEMLQHQRAVAQEKLRQARAEAGAMPWRTVPNRPQ